ncbi:MAG: hypothetical protein WDZ28_03655 [Simkaniaceae bacterium]
MTGKFRKLSRLTKPILEDVSVYEKEESPTSLENKIHKIARLIREEISMEKTLEKERVKQKKNR